MRLRVVTTLCAATMIGVLSGSGTSSSAAEGVGILRGVVRQGGKPARDVVIWLDAPNAPANFTRQSVLAQRHLKFYPHVLAVQAGSVVEFPNQDRVFHNVFSFHDGKRFDLGLYPTGVTRRITFERSGLSRIFCNIHPLMSAYVLAVPSPYFALSDEAGNFTIPGVPFGTYTYHAWRAGGPELQDAVAIVADTRMEIRWP
jgi:plastocyanin